MSEGPALAISVVLLGLNAFFVGAEFALISARRSAIEPLAEAGHRLAKATLGAMENVSLMMAGAQLGITVCSLGLGYLGEPAVAHLIEGPLETIGTPEGLLHPIAFAIALSIVAFLHIVLGEMVPKNIALAGPDRSALALGAAAGGDRAGPAPGDRLAQLDRQRDAAPRRGGPARRGGQHLHPRRGRGPRARVAPRGDARRARRRASGRGARVRGADDRTVLLPLAELETVTEEVSPAQLEVVAARTGFSRFPVQAGGQLIGYLHIKDALEFEDGHRDSPIAAGRIRRLPEVGVNDRLRAALATMQASEAHLGSCRRRRRRAARRDRAGRRARGARRRDPG